MNMHVNVHTYWSVHTVDFKMQCIYSGSAGGGAVYLNDAWEWWAKTQPSFTLVCCALPAPNTICTRCWRNMLRARTLQRQCAVWRHSARDESDHSPQHLPLKHAVRELYYSANKNINSVEYDYANLQLICSHFVVFKLNAVTVRGGVLKSLQSARGQPGLSISQGFDVTLWRQC